MRRGFRQLLAGAIALAFAVPAIAQSTGTITGRVTERQTQRPLGNVQVRVVGSNRGAVTDDSGSYRITNVPAGPAQVAAQRLGYGPQSRSVSVTAGGTVTADFTMAAAVTTLDAITVTATGQSERRRESGASTATIDASLNKAAVSTLSDALSSRVARRRRADLGRRKRRRDAHAHPRLQLHLAVERAAADHRRRSARQHVEVVARSGTGGQLPSRFNDINPEEIESIEIIKGPAAAALYGTAAANGVIQITTKKGRAGQDAMGRVRRDGHSSTTSTTIRLNMRSYGHTATGALRTNCSLFSRDVTAAPRLRRGRFDDLEHPDRSRRGSCERREPAARRPERHAAASDVATYFIVRRIPEGTERRADQRASSG